VFPVKGELAELNTKQGELTWHVPHTVLSEILDTAWQSLAPEEGESAEELDLVPVIPHLTFLPYQTRSGKIILHTVDALCSQLVNVQAHPRYMFRTFPIILFPSKSWRLMRRCSALSVELKDSWVLCAITLGSTIYLPFEAAMIWSLQCCSFRYVC
jgi:hypothetical protein